MKSMVGQAAASPRNVLLKTFSSRPPFSRGTYKAQWTLEPWICQRCLLSNRRVLDLKKKLDYVPSSRSQAFRETKLLKAGFSTSQRKAQSRDTDNASDKPRNDLPSQEEGRRSQTSKRFTHIMDHLQSNIFIAGQRLNDLTGYSGIEALKKDIEQQGQFPTCLLPA